MKTEPDTSELDRLYLAGKGRLSEQWFRRELEAALRSYELRAIIGELVNSAVIAHLKRARFRQLVREAVDEALEARRR